MFSPSVTVTQQEPTKSLSIGSTNSTSSSSNLSSETGLIGQVETGQTLYDHRLAQPLADLREVRHAPWKGQIDVTQTINGYTHDKTMGFDSSKPDGKKWSLIQYDGKTPNQKALKNFDLKYQDRGHLQVKKICDFLDVHTMLEDEAFFESCAHFESLRVSQEDDISYTIDFTPRCTSPLFIDMRKTFIKETYARFMGSIIGNRIGAASNALLGRLFDRVAGRAEQHLTGSMRFNKEKGFIDEIRFRNSEQFGELGLSIDTLDCIVTMERETETSPIRVKQYFAEGTCRFPALPNITAEMTVDFRTGEQASVYEEAKDSQSSMEQKNASTPLNGNGRSSNKNSPPRLFEF